MLEKLEFYVDIEFFMSETARHADIVLPGSQHEEDEGVSRSAEGPRHQDQQGDRAPGRRRAGLENHPGHCPAPWARAGLHLRQSARRFSRSCAAPPRAASPITPALLMTRSRARWASSGPVRPPARWPADRSCRNAAALRRDPGIRSHEERVRFISPTARPASTPPSTPLPRKKSTRNTRFMLTTGRVVSQFLSGMPDAAHRPLGRSISRTAAGIASACGRAAWHRRRRLGRGRVAARRDYDSCQVVATIRPDTVFVPYHWAGPKSINRVTIAAQDPISKIPEYKVCAVRVAKAQEPQYFRTLEPQQ